jgi:hypothetical protein
MDDEWEPPKTMRFPEDTQGDIKPMDDEWEPPKTMRFPEDTQGDIKPMDDRWEPPKTMRFPEDAQGDIKPMDDGWEPPKTMRFPEDRPGDIKPQDDTWKRIPDGRVVIKGEPPAIHFPDRGMIEGDAPEAAKDLPTTEQKEIIPNKEDGDRRQREVGEELKEKYPESEGYQVLPERELCDENGNSVRDPETGQKRRIDYVVLDKDGNVVDCVEVTSKTADKTKQIEKENRIKENGGNYVRDKDGKTHRIPDDMQTRIERRD